MLGLILAGASLAVSAGQAIAAKKGAKKQAAAISAAAIASRNESFRQLNLQESQQTDAATQTLGEINRQALGADALARVSAGEAGVSGASVDAIANDITAQAGLAKAITGRNLQAVIAQIQEQKRGVAVDAQNRINQAKAGVPTGVEMGLNLLSQGLNFASSRIASRPVSSKVSGTFNPNDLPIYIPVNH